MALDRDLGVAVMRRAGEMGMPLRSGWEMLAATGIRGLRLLAECGRPARLWMSEAGRQAIEVLRSNASRYRDRGARALYLDARWTPPLGPFDYVDLDPYGSPLPFLPSALRGCAAGTLLAVTATDLAVLSGASRGAGERRYGGRPLPGYLAGEGGLRLVLASVERAAATVGLSILPLLGYVGDHHVRAYLRLRTAGGASPVGVLPGPDWTGPLLPEGAPFGPMWTGPLFDPTFLRGLAVPSTAEHPGRLAQFLSRVQEESAVDRPLFYEPNRLASQLGLAEPPSPSSIIERLRGEGWQAARSHVRPSAFRTDAPRERVEAAARSAASQSQNARVRA